MVYSLHKRLILGIVYEYLFVLTSGFTWFTSISTQFSCYFLHNFLLCFNFIWSTPPWAASPGNIEVVLVDAAVIGHQAACPGFRGALGLQDVQCVSKPNRLTLLRSRAEVSPQHCVGLEWTASGDGVASTCLLKNVVRWMCSGQLKHRWQQRWQVNYKVPNKGVSNQ